MRLGSAAFITWPRGWARWQTSQSFSMILHFVSMTHLFCRVSSNGALHQNCLHLHQKLFRRNHSVRRNLFRAALQPSVVSLQFLLRSSQPSVRAFARAVLCLMLECSLSERCSCAYEFRTCCDDHNQFCQAF